MGILPTKPKKVFYLLGGMILLSLVALGLVLLGKYYSGQVLKNMVERETKGRYELSFEDLNFDLLDKKVHLTNIRLLPDTTDVADSVDQSILYDIHIDTVYIQLESIWSLYIDRKLLINNVRIVDPVIFMLSNPMAGSDDSFSKNTGDLHKAILNHLKALQIDYFKIEDGSLAHEPSQFSIKNLDFFVEHFFMDSTERKEDIFFSESITLEINDQRYILPDSLHQIAFDKMELSTKDSVLSFEGIALQPRPGIKQGELRVLNTYDITVPQLQLKGVDYLKAYRENQLDINELVMQEARVFVDDHSEKSQTSEKRQDNSLLKLLVQTFSAVDIARFDIKNTQLNISTNTKGLEKLKASRSNITMAGFHLDSANAELDYHKQYFDNLAVNLEQYAYQLPDSIHVLQFEGFDLSTKDSLLHLKNLRIAPRSGMSRSLLFDLHFPDFKIKGIDYMKALLLKELNIENIVLTGPDLKFQNLLGQSDSPKAVFTVKDLFDNIKPHFKKVSVGHIQLKDGHLNLQPQLTIGSVSMDLLAINLSASTRTWSGIYRDISLNGRRISWSDDTFTATGNRARARLSKKNIQLCDWSFQYRHMDQWATTTFDTLILSGLEPAGFAGSNPVFDSLTLINPVVNFNIKTPEQKQNTDSMARPTRHFVIKNGYIGGTVNDTLNLSIQKLFTHFRIHDNYIHRLQTENLSFISGQNTITSSAVQFEDSLSYLTLDDLTYTTASSPKPSISIPQTEVYGWRQKAYWLLNEWILDSLVLTRPNINHVLSPAMGKKPTSDSSLVVKVGQIQMDQGRLRLEQLSGNKQKKVISADTIDATLSNFHYPYHQFVSHSSLVYSKSVSLDVSGLTPAIGKADSLHVGNLRFESPGGQLDLLSIYFQSGDDEKMKAHIPSVHLKGLDLYTYYRDESFKADSLHIQNPNLSLIETAFSKGSEPVVQPVSLQHLAITNGHLNFENEQQQVYQWKDGRLVISGLFVADTLRFRQLPRYIDSLAFSGADYSQKLNDGYSIHLDQYFFEHPKNMLTLEGITLKNKLSKQAFTQQLKYQNDWFDVAVDQITLDQVDLNALLQKSRFDIEKAGISDSEIMIYRDKAVPFPENQVRYLPQQMLLERDEWMHVDTLTFTGQVTYQERQAKNGEVAEITFSNLSANIANITTVDSLAVHPMRLWATGTMLDQANFEVGVLFDMRHPRHRFNFSGSIDEFSLDAMNSLLIPAAQVNVKEGLARELNFSFTANDELARGQMKFKYKDLKVQILNPETMDTQGLGQGIKTFFANTFVIHKRNPRFLFLMRNGTIFSRRDTSRAVFNYWAKALLSGAVSSVGINKSKRQEKKFEKSEKKDAKKASQD